MESPVIESCFTHNHSVNTMKKPLSTIKLFLLETNISQEIRPQITQSEYSIGVYKKKFNIPKNLHKFISQRWNLFKHQNPTIASNRSTIYLQSFSQNGKQDKVALAPFKFAQILGRDQESIKYGELSEALQLVALSSLCLVETSDNKLVFGLKSNMSSKLSAFSGYCSKKEINGGYVNIHKYLSRTLLNELNILQRNIETIKRIGQTYSPHIQDNNQKLNIRIVNNDFLIKLNISSQKLRKFFKPTFQFKKILFINNRPEIILSFVRKNQHQFSSHCIGAIYNYLVLMYPSVASQIFKLKTLKLYRTESIKKTTNSASSIYEAVRSKRWGLIGNSKIAQYSIAPTLWNNFFNITKTEMEHFVLATDNEEQVKKFILNFRKSPSFLGANIALPWKKIVYTLCDKIEPIAKHFEAVNTIIIRNKNIYGYNTDGIGLCNAILQVASLKNSRVLLIGCGGGAQTVPYHLFKNKISEIHIYDLDFSKTKELARKTKKLLPRKKINACKYFPECTEFDFVINATPCGMSNQDQFPFQKELISQFKKNCIFVEMVYNPLFTPFLIQARKKGHLIISGIEMLIHQAKKSYSYFSENKIPISYIQDLRKKLINHLERMK